MLIVGSPPLSQLNHKPDKAAVTGMDNLLFVQ